jgi:hypothetical protein
LFFASPFKVIKKLTFVLLTKKEAVELEKKIAEVKKVEKIERAVGFIFSRSGFTKDAENYCREQGIACSEDERWLETGKLK